MSAPAYRRPSECPRHRFQPYDCPICEAEADRVSDLDWSIDEPDLGDLAAGDYFGSLGP